MGYLIERIIAKPTIKNNETSFLAIGIAQLKLEIEISRAPPVTPALSHLFLVCLILD